MLPIILILYTLVHIRRDEKKKKIKSSKPLLSILCVNLIHLRTNTHTHTHTYSDII
jgi:hypothetical protein